MHDWLSLTLMFACGMVLGGLYFFGLWFTVRRIRSERNPSAWIIGSMILRMVLLLVAFYFILRYGDWMDLLAVFAGFMVMRMITTRRMRQLIQSTVRIKE